MAILGATQVQQPVVNKSNIKADTKIKEADIKPASLRAKEVREKQKQYVYEEANYLYKMLVDKRCLSNLDDRCIAFVRYLCMSEKEKSKSRQIRNKTSIFVKLYGENAKVGDAVTLKDIFDKTSKGRSTMDATVRRWARIGIVVAFDEDKERINNSRYVITALPD